MRVDLTCLPKYIHSDGVDVRPTKIIFSSLRKLLISPFLSDSKSYSEPKCQSLSMAASSSSNPCNSNPTPCWKYHVFLSFRGEDTRLNFTDHLYSALWRKGIMTFRDDKQLEKGEVIKYKLLQAIEESLCAIVILSQNYASSSWCLEELQKILECRGVSGRWVLPVFYGIDPSVVRQQTGSFDDAFRKHEVRFGEDKTKVQKWRDALSEVANISGYHSENQSEAELIEKIIRELWPRVESHLPSYSKDGLVGIDSKLEDMCQILEIGSLEVRFVGIWGMGGMGKTTLARLVFNQFHSYFDISCCLENVRETSSAVDGLLCLQLKLLSKLKIGNLEIDNVDQGKAKIRNLLCRMKVLLLLDDVDHMIQLEYLVGKQDWFGQGSRVIVTARNKHVLDSHQAPFNVYKIGALNTNESLELFWRKAFKENQPKEGYVDLSNKFLEYCQGIPFALKVLGSFLYERDISAWEDALKKIRKDPPKDIMDTLRISFEGLDDAEKNIFLDIACFFKGWDKNRVMQILEICGFYPKIGTKILIERSLLACNGESFWMHDLLQEMGRNIVSQKSGGEKGKQSRLWSLEDIDDVLGKNTGTEFVQGVVLKTDDYKARCDPEAYKARCDPEAFSKMCNLRVLIFDGLHLQLPLGLKCLSNSIKVLEWREYPLPSLPLGVKLQKLVELKLCWGKIKQLWHGSQDFENLKLIDLSFSKDLIHTPNFFGAPNLESLILEGCSNLGKIHPSIGQLRKLVVLNLKDCINLKYLPSKLETPNLEILILEGCSNLVGIHPSIGQLRKLVVLNLKDCTNLKYFPSKLETNCLKDVNLCGCSKVQNPLEIVENMKENKSLERLDLSETAIEEVPSSISGFQNLKWLSVRGCRGQISKPCWKFWRSSMPMGLKLPPLSGLRMLRELDASYCNLSSESVADINCLPSLEILRLSGNNFRGDFHLSQFSDLSKLKELDLSYCSLNDESIPDDLSYLPSLEQLILCRNNFVNLPHGCISNLTCLWYLNLDSCSKLQALPVFPPSVRSVLARNCHPIELLPETQILKLLMSRLNASLSPKSKLPAWFFINQGAVILGNEIPAWFDKQKDVPSFWKFSRYQDSIIVDIPECCHSARELRIGFCYIVEPPNNADLNKEKLNDADLNKECLFRYTWDIFYVFGSATKATPPYNGSCMRNLNINYWGFNRSHQFIEVLTCKPCEDIDGDAGKQIQLFFGVCRRDSDPSENLNISKCGWRVICEHHIQRRATMSDFGNTQSNSNSFNKSRLIEMKDGKRHHDEFEGQDEFGSDDESKLEHNARRKT